MVVTSNTTKYTIENDLTKKRKKEENNKQTAAVFMVTKDYHLRDGRVLAAFAYV